MLVNNKIKTQQKFKYKLKPLNKKNPNELLVLMIVTLVLGIFFRFANIDQKPYWNDEVFTSLRISGHAAREVFEDQVITSQNLHKRFQFPNPERGLIDTVKGLAKEEPQLPPLYFTMARWWVKIFGSSVTATRSLSALISLAAFPLIYWLCLELFESPLVGGVAVAVMAISPFHVLYAQEARPYSLWTVTILLSSVALLRALRTKTPLNWGIYAITLGIGFYTYIFTGLVAIAHGIYVAVLERFKLSKVLISYLLASLVGILTFIPWIVLIIANFSKTPKIQSQHPLLSVVQNWILNINLIFIDLNYQFNYGKFFFAFISIVLIVYSLYFLYHQGSKKSFLFIIALIGATGVAVIFPDFFTLENGKTSARLSQSPRYLIALYLGIQLSVAHLLATKISLLNYDSTRRQLWKIATIFLVTVGVLSCSISSQAEIWWNKYFNIHDLEVAEIIEQNVNPLVISKQIRAISLSYDLEEKAKFLFSKKEKISIPDDFQSVFIYASGWDKEVDENKIPYEIENFQDHEIELVKTWKTKLDPVRTMEALLWKVSKKEV